MLVYPNKPLKQELFKITFSWNALCCFTSTSDDMTVSVLLCDNCFVIKTNCDYLFCEQALRTVLEESFVPGNYIFENSFEMENYTAKKTTYEDRMNDKGILNDEKFRRKARWRKKKI